ncbi:dihydrodipicolinate synthase family protein [Luteitalea sp. TBR-22]|uniref:dihydrodipicolinate synthase family protein n=1 Tax=Luteitalea sp. TBR-22 TaxID=2802971 RepID=UPI001AF68288|nr:dihydrodipicolinate synthase family protein [Luteitalea sp. TBR-22]BCS35862.1 dihydrodipicolinate synthase family protein [Luteitalea sp. TBR-22]
MLRGVYPPLPTPFTDDDLDEGLLRDTVAALMRSRLAGLLVLGTNGESFLIEPAEADRVVRVTRDAMPEGRRLLAGTGCDSTRATLEACRRAADNGADYALVRPPTSYTRFMTQDVLTAHYEHIADESPIPVLLYNQPQVFGAELAAPTVALLARHENVAGLKDSSGNVAHVNDVLARVPDGFSVLTGVAGIMYAALLSGTSGSIVALANVVPNLCVELYDSVMKGELHRALALQRAVAPLARAVTITHGVAGLKAAMTIAGYPSSTPRLPLQPATPKVEEELLGLLRHLEAFTGWTLVGRDGQPDGPAEAQ